VSKDDCVGFQVTSVSILPPRFLYSFTKRFLSATPNASLRAPTATDAPLPNAPTAACASTRPCRLSDERIRQR
jgi:hypothetical protein